MQQMSVTSAGARHVMLELMAVGVGGGAGGARTTGTSNAARLALLRGEAAPRALQARRPGRRLGKSEEVMLRRKILLSSNAVSCLGRGNLLQRSPNCRFSSRTQGQRLEFHIKDASGSQPTSFPGSSEEDSASAQEAGGGPHGRRPTLWSRARPPGRMEPPGQAHKFLG